MVQSEQRAERLDGVFGARQNDDGNFGGTQDHHVHPGTKEGGQRTPEFVVFRECFEEVGVFSAGARNDGAKFSKAEST